MLNIQSLANRDEIPLLLKEQGYTGIGAEIGVQSGCYSRILLEGSLLKCLFSIDPWSKPADSDVAHLSEPELYIETVRLLCPFGLRSVVLRMYSETAAELFRDESMDFVYIDGWHWLPGITQDLQLWWPKIRPGGILAGHDYCDFHVSVPQAVDAFVAANGLRLHLTEQDFVFKEHVIRSWLVVKPDA